MTLVPVSYTHLDVYKRQPVHRLIKDKSLLMIDDSIVRGTQLRETTEFLYRNGAKEVHIRPACPPLLYGCKYLNFSRSKSEMDLITRRVIAKREGENVSDKVLADYADPNSTNYKEMPRSARSCGISAEMPSPSSRRYFAASIARLFTDQGIRWQRTSSVNPSEAVK